MRNRHRRLGSKRTGNFRMMSTSETLKRNSGKKNCVDFKEQEVQNK